MGADVGQRHEVGEKVRVTSIEPGAVESDLKFTTSGAAAETVLDFYKQAIPAASVARAIAFAVEQSDDVDVNAIVIRPTAQQFCFRRGGGAACAPSHGEPTGTLVRYFAE